MAVTPPPMPLQSRKRKSRSTAASPPSAPSTAEDRAERAAAPAPGARRNPNAVPNWQSLLVATLERSKRYPSEARARGEQGVAQLAFSIDRNGGVHHARIVHSSGSERARQRDVGADRSRATIAAATAGTRWHRNRDRRAYPLQHPTMISFCKTSV